MFRVEYMHYVPYIVQGRMNVLLPYAHFMLEFIHYVPIHCSR